MVPLLEEGLAPSCCAVVESVPRGKSSVSPRASVCEHRLQTHMPHDGNDMVLQRISWMPELRGERRLVQPVRARSPKHGRGRNVLRRASGLNCAHFASHYHLLETLTGTTARIAEALYLRLRSRSRLNGSLMRHDRGTARTHGDEISTVCGASTSL